MGDRGQQQGPIRFGVFEADLAARTLRKSGARVRLQDQPFRVLAMLLARPGEVVTREELKQALWPNEEYGEFDLGLNTAVKKVRQALNDSGDSPRWIETVPKVGYKFLAPVDAGARDSTSSPDNEQRAPRSSRGLLAAGSLLAAGCFALGWFFGPERGAPASPASFHLELPPPPGVAYTAFALSPDGSRIAFIGEGPGAPRLWVQSLVDRTHAEIDGTAGAEPLGIPFWSADGLEIGFFAEGKLKRVPAAGGPVQTLCAAPFGRGGAWNDEGKILYVPRTHSDLWTVDLRDLVCKPLFESESEQVLASSRFPRFLPGDGRILYSRFSGPQNPHSLLVASLGSSDAFELTRDLPPAVFAPRGEGYLLYVRDEVLFARAVDIESRSLEDRPEFALAQAVGFDPMLRRGLFDAVDTGVLAYLPSGAESRKREIAWFDRAGRRLSSVAPARTFGFTISLGWDANTAATWDATVLSGSNQQVLAINLATGLPMGVADGVLPAYSLDGSHLFYTSAEGLMIKPAAGGAARVLVPQALEESSGGAKFRPFYCTIDPRQGTVIYQRRSPDTGWDLWTAGLDSDPPRKLLAETWDEGYAQLSPDGRWLAYVSNRDGGYEVYVAPYPSMEGEVRVSRDGGSAPRWRRDQSELFYLDRSGVLTAVSIAFEMGELRPTAWDSLFPVSSPYSNLETYLFAPLYPYDVSADGRRFLALWRPPDMPFPPLQVITNWPARLDKDSRVK